MRAAYVVRLNHVAALIHIETVGGVGGIARGIKDAGGGEGVSSAPANHFAPKGEIEIARGEAGVGFLHANGRGGVCVFGGETDEAGGEGEAALIADVEGGFDEDLVEDCGLRCRLVVIEGGVVNDGEGVVRAYGFLFGGRRILRRCTE